MTGKLRPQWLGGPLALKTIIRINRVKLLLLIDSLHFIFIDQHFVEFFSPADAGDFDWIIGLARALTYRIGQSLNGACRRFSNKDFTAPGLGHGMEHQLNRLIQREQEAGHFRDGHGQWLALLQLV